MSKYQIVPPANPGEGARVVEWKPTRHIVPPVCRVTLSAATEDALLGRRRRSPAWPKWVGTFAIALVAIWWFS